MPVRKFEDMKLEEESPSKRMALGYRSPTTPSRAEPEIDASDSEFIPSPESARIPGTPGTSGTPTRKALRARAKALIEKFEVVQDNIKNELEKDDEVVVDTFHRAESKTAPLGRNYDYIHLLKLRSDNPFNLLGSVMLNEGPYKGHVAIIVKQSRPFKLMALKKEIRARILHFVVSNDGKPVVMALKQGGTKSAHAPEYATKNRLAILQTSKQIYNESIPLLFDQVFQFPGTQVIASWLLKIGRNREHVRYIRSDSYSSQSARTVFYLLQEAKRLKQISFAHISSNEQPKTAIKNIYNDANTWMLGIDKDNPFAAIDLLSFDNDAFHWREKNEDGSVRVIQWGPAEKILFLKGLRMKLESAHRKMQF